MELKTFNDQPMGPPVRRPCRVKAGDEFASFFPFPWTIPLRVQTTLHSECCQTTSPGGRGGAPDTLHTRLPFHLAIFVPTAKLIRSPSFIPRLVSSFFFVTFPRSTVFTACLPPALGVAAFPGLRCYRVAASPVRLQPRLEPNPDGEEWSLWLSVLVNAGHVVVLCTCLYLTLEMYRVRLQKKKQKQKKAARPAASHHPPPPFYFCSQATFPSCRHGARGASPSSASKGERGGRRCWSVHGSHNWFWCCCCYFFFFFLSSVSGRVVSVTKPRGMWRGK